MKICCFGDIGNCSQDLNKIITNINIKKNKNIYILLGDNFYPTGLNTDKDKNIDEFKNIFQKIKKEYIYAILGNHDYIGNPTLQINAPFWTMHNFYYFVKLNENTGLWFIDTQILDPGESGEVNPFLNLYDQINKYHGNYIKIFNKQLNWLENSFETHKKLKNKIVFGHYPIISAGAYDKNDKLYSVLLKNFYKYNISAYISGHDHNLQHLELMIGPNYVFNQFISGCNDSEHVYNIYNKSNISKFFAVDPGFLQLSILKSGRIKYEFKNEKLKSMYKIII